MLRRDGPGRCSAWGTAPRPETKEQPMPSFKSIITTAAIALATYVAYEKYGARVTKAL
jgi:hypothetical protein